MRSAYARLAAQARANDRPVVVAAARTAESIVRRRVPSWSAPLVPLGRSRVLVRADLSRPTGMRLFRYGFRDPVAWAVDTLLAPGDTFFDAGANIGLMTLVGAARVGRQGRVVSLEPAPATASLLRANVAANGFAWVTVREQAVGAARGVGDLVEFEAGAGLHSLAPADRSAGSSVTVDVVTLDEVAAEHGSPALVKLDVEGAEVAAIAGARRLLESRHTAFIVEIEPGHLARQGARVQELQSAFAGYESCVVVTAPGGFSMVPWDRDWDNLPEGPNLVLRP